MAISFTPVPQEHAVGHLLRAIRTLDAADQDAVLALLLGGLLDRSAAAATASNHPDTRRRLAAAALGHAELLQTGFIRSHSQAPAGAETRVVPIRFPAHLHEELRAWCEEHGFPMAAVVRGLTERFLESQRPARG